MDESIANHKPLKVTRKNGDAFVVLWLEDYQREQETLYVLSNTSLMEQISTSLKTYNQKSGYAPSSDELGLDKID
ncbi:MAG: type II toxin-antitoxin system Phd/YefM family antitoxin [Campylobacterales bacterium]|nr:type II toxin-antitoxin system Phd/YefM family antitoxin [Campylobacterales bacterium]